MRVLGLLMVRNGASVLPECLRNMATYCDQIAAIDDRSVDASGTILRAHHAVGYVLSVDRAISTEEWHFPESTMLEVLLRIADLDSPDWVISLDCDQRIEPPEQVRPTLAALGFGVAAVRVPLVSLWQDTNFPAMVPIMGSATRLCTNVWRHQPGLRAGAKALHNPRVPEAAANRGETATGSWFFVSHTGWDTLAKRIARVDFYTSRDPDYELNEGVRYDEGLLFGYRRDRIDDLIAEYERRRRRHQGGEGGEPGGHDPTVQL